MTERNDRLRNSDRPFHPEAWDYLQRLRDRYADRPEQDRPDWVVVPDGDDGSINVRPLRWSDIERWLDSQVQGEVT